MCVVPDFCTVYVSPLLLSLSHTGQSINLQATVVPSDRFRMYNGAQVTHIWVSPSHQFTSITRIMCNNLCYLTATNQSLRSKTIRHSISFASKSSWQGAKCTPTTHPFYTSANPTLTKHAPTVPLSRFTIHATSLGLKLTTQKCNLEGHQMLRRFVNLHLYTTIPNYLLTSHGNFSFWPLINNTMCVHCCPTAVFVSRLLVNTVHSLSAPQKSAWMCLWSRLSSLSNKRKEWC